LCRYVVREFVYDEKEIAEDNQRYVKLVDEKRTQFVSFVLSVKYSKYAMI